MKKKEILEKCEMIYSTFDSLELNRSNCQARDYGEIRSFAWDLLDREKRVKAALGERYEEIDSEYLIPLNLDLFETGFGFGYAIGRAFETGYPKIEDAVKSIQALLKEKALLPYFPRGRKEKRMP